MDDLSSNISVPQSAPDVGGGGRSRIDAELRVLREKRLSSTNKGKFKGDSVPLTPEEKDLLLAQARLIPANKTHHPPPPTRASGSEWDSWYSQQRKLLQDEKKRRSEAEKLLRGYRGASVAELNIRASIKKERTVSARQVRYVQNDMAYKGEKSDMAQDGVKKAGGFASVDGSRVSFDSAKETYGSDEFVTEGERELLYEAEEQALAEILENNDGDENEHYEAEETDGDLHEDMKPEGEEESARPEADIETTPTLSDEPDELGVPKTPSDDNDEIARIVEETNEHINGPNGTVNSSEENENVDNEDKQIEDEQFEDEEIEDVKTEDEQTEDTEGASEKIDEETEKSGGENEVKKCETAMDDHIEEIEDDEHNMEIENTQSSSEEVTVVPPNQDTIDRVSSDCYRIDFSVAGLGKHLPSTKRRIRWQFCTPTTSHVVLLYWSLTSGKRILSHNDITVHASQKRSGKFSHKFTIEDVHPPLSVHVVAFAGVASRQYDLFIDGVSFFHLQKREKNDDFLMSAIGLKDRGNDNVGAGSENNDAEFEDEGFEVVHSEGMELVEGEQNESEKELDTIVENMAHLSLLSPASMEDGEVETVEEGGDVMSPEAKDARVVTPGLFGTESDEDTEEKKRDERSDDQTTLEDDTVEVPTEAHVTLERNITDDDSIVPEPDRYHLYASYSCPESHHALLILKLRKLSSCISVTILDPIKSTQSHVGNDEQDDWMFATKDPHGARNLKELYQQLGDTSTPTEECTLPLLWDKHAEEIATNNASKIFHTLHCFSSKTNLLPLLQQPTITTLEQFLSNFQTNIRKCGCATTQDDYLRYARDVTNAFDKLEAILENSTFIAGEELSNADLLLFVTLLRFDEVYTCLYKVNSRFVSRSNVLMDYCRSIYQMEGVKETCDMDQIKSHYYSSYKKLNPSGIIPIGMGFMDLLEETHNSG
jgi:putative glutathione S-transferase